MSHFKMFPETFSGKHLQNIFGNILNCKTFQKMFKEWYAYCVIKMHY